MDRATGQDRQDKDSKKKTKDRTFKRKDMQVKGQKGQSEEGQS